MRVVLILKYGQRCKDTVAGLGRWSAVSDDSMNINRCLTEPDPMPIMYQTVETAAPPAVPINSALTKRAPVG
jgi:hypothetical protein